MIMMPAEKLPFHRMFNKIFLEFLCRLDSVPTHDVDSCCECVFVDFMISVFSLIVSVHLVIVSLPMYFFSPSIVRVEVKPDYWNW